MCHAKRTPLAESAPLALHPSAVRRAARALRNPADGRGGCRWGAVQGAPQHGQPLVLRLYVGLPVARIDAAELKALRHLRAPSASGLGARAALPRCGRSGRSA